MYVYERVVYTYIYIQKEGGEDEGRETKRRTKKMNERERPIQHYRCLLL